ncbi:hypothetical protein RPHASCH2410_CH08160 [Rhizobium phaseoli Ch24-10]|nr:hypothetical protein RPHASCH2410_CH08160 [Rhizobium phaseoli Ch24-10]
MRRRLPAVGDHRQNHDTGFSGGAQKQVPEFVHSGLPDDGIGASLHSRDIFLSVVKRPFDHQNLGCVSERPDDLSPAPNKENERRKIHRCVPLHGTFSTRIRILVIMQLACRARRKRHRCRTELPTQFSATAERTRR